MFYRKIKDQRIRMTENRPKTLWLKRLFIIVLMLIIYALIVSGAVYFGTKYSGSRMLGIVLAAGLGGGLLLLLFFGLRAKKAGRQKKYIKAITLVLTVAFICVNIPLLITSYFVPHRTTTIFNRYYPDSLVSSYLAEKLVTGKTLMVDESNVFLNQDEADYTAIDHINIVSLMSSAAQIETLEEPFGQLTQVQVDYLLDESIQYLIFDNTFNRDERMYLYNGTDLSACDTIVYLEDSNQNFYFIPYTLFSSMKEAGRND